MEKLKIESRKNKSRNQEKTKRNKIEEKIKLISQGLE